VEYAGLAILWQMGLVASTLTNTENCCSAQTRAYAENCRSGRLPTNGSQSSFDKIRGIPLSLPCHSENNGERQRNPDILTPKGPQQEPYALAGGPELHAPPVVHGSLAPSAAKTQSQAHAKALAGLRCIAARRARGAASPSDEIAARRKAAAAALEVGPESCADRNRVLRVSERLSVGARNQPAAPFLIEDLPNPLQPCPSFGGVRHEGDTMPSAPKVVMDAAPGPPAATSAELLDAYRERLRTWMRRTECGVRCQIYTQSASGFRLATYMYHVATGTIRIIPIASSPDEALTIRVSGICNIWVDSDAARDGSGIIKPMEAFPQVSDTGTAPVQLFGNSPEGFMHLDTCDGHVGLIERDAAAREEFLDSVAVLIATTRKKARIRGEKPPSGPHGSSPRPELLSAWQAEGEAARPSARSFEALRPKGASLTAAFLVGAAGDLLAQVGEPVVPDVVIV